MSPAEDCVWTRELMMDGIGVWMVLTSWTNIIKYRRIEQYYWFWKRNMVPDNALYWVGNSGRQLWMGITGRQLRLDKIKIID